MQKLANSLKGKKTETTLRNGKKLQGYVAEVEERTFLSMGLDLNMSPEINTWSLVIKHYDTKMKRTVDLGHKKPLTVDNVNAAMPLHKVRFI